MKVGFMIEYTLSEADIAETTRLRLTPFLTWPRYLLYAIGIFLLFAVLIPLLKGEAITTTSLITGLASTLVAVPLLVILLPRALAYQSVRNFRTNRFQRAPKQALISSDGIEVTSPNGHQKYVWSDFKGWGEDDKYFLFLIGGPSFIPLPKRSMNLKDIDAVHAILAAKTLLKKIG
jgi:hypothetical protein